MKLRTAIWGAIALAACLTLVLLVRSKQSLRQVAMTIDVQSAKLAGTLYIPTRSKKTAPVVILLHGSGPDGRSNVYYQQLAEQFANVGYATFIYDKRGSGKSSGNLYAVPFKTIIDDAVIVVEYLRKRPETDDNRIVIWGGSEGGSIAPEVAVRSQANAVITQSASGVPFWKQNRYQNLLALQNAGLGEPQLDVELRAHEAAMHYARTGKDWAEFERLRNSGITLPIRNSRTDVWWTWYGTKLDYEPTSWLRQLKVPILAMWGKQDVLVPVDESMDLFKNSLLNNQLKTILLVNPADHGMSNGGNLVHLETMNEWLKSQL